MKKKLFVIGVIMLFLTSAPIILAEQRLTSQSHSMKKTNDLSGNTEILSWENPGNSFDPVVVVDKWGTTHVVFSSTFNFTSELWLIYKYKPLGGSWSVPELLPKGTSYSALNPALTVDKNGVLYASWREDPLDMVHFPQIFYSSKPKNEPWTTPELLSTSDIGPLHSSIGVDSTGTVHVVWDRGASCGETQTSIYYRQKQKDSAWGTTDIISLTGTGFCERPSLAVDLNNNVHVAWLTSNHVYYRMKPSDESWLPVETVWVGEPYDKPSMAIDREGNVHISWADKSFGSQDRICYKEKPALGDWGIVEILTPEINAYAFYPSLDVDLNGTTHVAWKNCSDIFYSSKPQNGDWSTRTLISKVNKGISDNPSLAVDSAGYIHVVWMDKYNYLGCGWNWNIFYFSPLNRGPVLVIENVTGGFGFQIHLRNIGNEPLTTATLYVNFTKYTHFFMLILFGSHVKKTISELGAGESLIIQCYTFGISKFFYIDYTIPATSALPFCEELTYMRVIGPYVSIIN